MEVDWAYPYVMRSGKVFCIVVSKIDSPWTPMNDKLILCHSIAQPIEAHVNRLGKFLFDSIIDATFGYCVVSLERSGWLFVAHFIKCSSECASLLGIDVGCTYFCFRGRSHDIAKNGTDYINWAIDFCAIHSFCTPNLIRFPVTERH